MFRLTHAIAAVALCAGCATTVERVATTAREDARAAEPAPDEQRQVAITRHRYSARLRGSEALEFVNDHGDLRLRTARDGGVHYAAVIQQLDGEQREPQFPTDRVEGGLRFAVAAPPDWIGRVDASARVPPMYPLTLRTRDGLIEVKAGDANIVARSDAGSIRYRGGGTVNARSESGSVHLSLTAGPPEEAVSKVYAGGDVELWLAADLDIVADLRARGGVVSSVGRDVGEVTTGPGRMRVRLGKATRVLRVEAGGTITVGVLPGG